MTQITVEIPDTQDVLLFRSIVERLGFKVTEEVSTRPEKDLTRYKAIIKEGIDAPITHLEDRLATLKADRQDRILPNR